jgi:hypothetical protein
MREGRSRSAVHPGHKSAPCVHCGVVRCLSCWVWLRVHKYEYCRIITTPFKLLECETEPLPSANATPQEHAMQ